MDLKHSGSVHLKNWKGKTNHTSNQQVLKMLSKHRHGSDMDVTSHTPISELSWVHHEFRFPYFLHLHHL